MTSAKQQAARNRNWKIHQLRMLWGQAQHLRPSYCETLRRMVDRELEDLGALTEAQHRLGGMFDD